MKRLILYPRADIAYYVRNYMIGAFSNLENLLPAIADCQLVVYVKGASTLIDAHGVQRAGPIAFIAGPSLTPRRFLVTPGSEFVAVTFRPHGLTACFGVPTNDCSGRLVPLEEVIARYEAERLLERLRSARGSLQIAAFLDDFLASIRQQSRGRRVLLQTLSTAQLMLPASALAEISALSTRQFERRFLAAYGLPLRDYRRLARFAVALGQMLSRPWRKGVMTRLAQDSHYFDQAHFIHDFREFVGESPGDFMRAQGAQDSIYKLWRLNREELRSYMD